MKSGVVGGEVKFGGLSAPKGNDTAHTEKKDKSEGMPPRINQVVDSRYK